MSDNAAAIKTVEILAEKKTVGYANLCGVIARLATVVSVARERKAPSAHCNCIEQELVMIQLAMTNIFPKRSLSEINRDVEAIVHAIFLDAREDE